MILEAGNPRAVPDDASPFACSWQTAPCVLPGLCVTLLYDCALISHMVTRHLGLEALYCQGSLEDQNIWTIYYKQRGFIRMAYRLWSSYSDSGCLPMEGPTIQESVAVQFMRLEVSVALQYLPEAQRRRL